MQKIELTDAGIELFCPFCGTKIIADDGISQCEHTLFISTDEGGFEYINPKLNIDKGIELYEKSMDEFTDEIEYPEGIKFALYQPAPSFFGAYVGFASV